MATAHSIPGCRSTRLQGCHCVQRALLPRLLTVLLAVACTVVRLPCARAQSIEPRAYSDIPVGVNFLIAGFAYTQGAQEFAPLPVSDPHFDSPTAILAYARSLDIAGKSAKFDVSAPYSLSLIHI